jgi:hypothetical protein
LFPQKIRHSSSLTYVSPVSTAVTSPNKKYHLYAPIIQLVNIQEKIYQTYNTIFLSNDLEMTLKIPSNQACKGIMKGNERNQGRKTII